MEHEIGETEGERLAQAHAVGKHEGIKEGRLSAFKEMRDCARDVGTELMRIKIKTKVK
jgi:flagellar biosynthesis/type III secretory pathway protein FliH